jgi:hypothetical protein
MPNPLIIKMKYDTNIISARHRGNNKKKRKKRKLPATRSTLLNFFKKKPGPNVCITILNYLKY